MVSSVELCFDAVDGSRAEGKRSGAHAIVTETTSTARTHCSSWRKGHTRITRRSAQAFGYEFTVRACDPKHESGVTALTIVDTVTMAAAAAAATIA